MPITPHTEQIGEHTYTMDSLGALTGRQVLLRLARPAGAIMAKAVGAAIAEKVGTRKLGLGDLSIEAALAGVGDALMALDDADLQFVCDKFASKCVVHVDDMAAGKTHQMPLAKIFDSHFAGRYDEMILWLWWGIRVNRFFGSALETLAKARVAMGAAEAKAKADETSPSESPTASTGGPGGSSSAIASTSAH